MLRTFLLSGRQRRWPASRHLLATLSGLLVAGCMVGPNYTEPSAITPDTWHQRVSADLHSGSSTLETWWRKFNDPTLNRIIGAARDSNRELAIAYERITEARASRGAASSQLFPQVEFDAAVLRQRNSENIGTPAPLAGKTNHLYVTGLDAGWEIDFFGGVRRSIEAADATVAGTEELYRDTMVALFAEAAINYIQVRTAEERIAVANKNIAAQEESVELTRSRLEAGLSPELDVAQAEANLATTRAVVPQLRGQRAQAVNRLATLIGRYPAAAESLLRPADDVPRPPASVGIGIPTDLIRSRPDIRAAERALAAETALIGVAEADLYPRFSLAGTFALQSLAAADLVQGSSRTYSFGPNIRWNIFSAGRIKSQIDVQRSRTRQALLAYEAAVLRGVEDVENSLATVRYEGDRQNQLGKAVEASQRSVELVTTNYTEGLIEFQNVLDAQRTVFANEDALAESRGIVAAGYVSLFKALGGGTSMRSAKSSSPN